MHRIKHHNPYGERTCDKNCVYKCLSNEIGLVGLVFKESHGGLCLPKLCYLCILHLTFVKQLINDEKVILKFCYKPEIGINRYIWVTNMANMIVYSDSKYRGICNPKIHYFNTKMTDFQITIMRAYIYGKDEKQIHNFSPQSMLTYLKLVEEDHKKQKLDAQKNTKIEEALVFNQEKSEKPSVDDCSICFMANETKTAMIPCGHGSFCYNCANRIRKQADICPICNQKITGCLRIF